MRAGADVKAANRYGVTPLSLACTNGNDALVERAAEGGRRSERRPAGRRDAVDDGGADRRARHRCRRCCPRRAVVDAKDDRRGQTALMWAAAEGHAPVVRALLDAGADPRARVPSGLTPLLFAVREGRLDAVRVLLAAGADANETIPVAKALAVAVAMAARCRPRARARCCSRCRTRISSWPRRCWTRAPIRTPR